MIMKVLLIRPPYSADVRSLAKLADFPLGLAYIAAVLEKEGHEVSVIDALIDGFDQELFLGGHLVRYGLSDEELSRRIEAFSPDVVGVSCLFSTQADNAHAVCRLVKNIRKSIITVMGGSHPSAMPVETLYDENVDYVIIGEAEHVMRDFLRLIQDDADLSRLDGFAFRRCGQTVVNPKTKFIEHLDQLPYPARGLFVMENYFEASRWQVPPRRMPAATMVSSRGCPANCIFCSIHTVWGKTFRRRSAENVLNEIGMLVREYGVKEIQFQDDNLTLDKKRLIEICDGIAARFPGLTWLATGTAIWALDEEMLTRMQESGCYRIYLPIESGDQEVLSAIVRKPLRLDRVPALVRKIKSIGMEAHGFFIVGLPGETPEQVKRTLRYARELRLDACYIYYATPYPGTDMYEICKQHNYIVDEDYKSLEPRRIHISTPLLPANTLRRIVRMHNIVCQWEMLLQHPMRESYNIFQKAWRDLKRLILGND
jgi:anaerobic magnesium-protoporphyrin IX monomethyl ester cyclase